jgi:hypothetical protein
MSFSIAARTLSIAMLTGLIGSQCLAAVTVLEGTDPAPPAAQPAPSLSPPPENPAPAPLPPVMESPQPGAGDAAAPAPAANPPVAEPSPAPPPQPRLRPSLAPRPEPSVEPPRTSSDVATLSGVTPPNPAQLAVEMLPGQTVTVGSFVSFKVTSKKPGYLVLMDVDATGHLTQIYPNTASLVRAGRSNANYVKPGSATVIPLPTDPYAGVRYMVAPPNGQAMIVGILSAVPVQILDLPDIPAELLGKPEMVLAYLSKRTNELRIPNQDDQLREGKWSFDARPYTIQ